MGTVRIIAGQWRGRKIHFPDVRGLRPTPDRVRETVFSWLTPYLSDANCLDLFSGSGALGFEALSRGARSVVMIDQEKKITDHLKQTAITFKAENLSIITARLPQQLTCLSTQFDIVFLDPPYRQNLIAPCCSILDSQHLLADHAFIYIEAERELTELLLPANWKKLKSKTAGDVGYHLYSGHKLMKN